MTIGITIVPGTFNPPADPVELKGTVTWPERPVGAQKQIPMQWQSQPQAVESDDTSVQYAERNFVTGVRKFRDSTAPTGAEASAITNIIASGVRYVGDGIYSVASQSSGLWTCAAVTEGNYTPTGLIELGSFTIGAGGIVRIQIPYVIALYGATDGAVYTLELEDWTGTHAVGFTGYMEVQLVGGSTEPGGTVEVNTTAPFIFRLLRNGVAYDTIEVRIPFHFLTTSVGTGGEYVHTESATFADNLFGPNFSAPFGTVPAVPFTSYIRSSNANKGSLSFS